MIDEYNLDRTGWARFSRPAKAETALRSWVRMAAKWVAIIDIGG